MPDAEIVAVIAFTDRASAIAPILEVSRGVWTAIFVISRSGSGAVFEAAPGRPVAVSEVGGAAAFVGEIASGEDGSRDFLDEFGGGFCAL